LEAKESADPAEAADPIDSTDAAEPTDPIDSTEPTDPIESTEPREAIDSSESVEAIESREPDPGTARIVARRRRKRKPYASDVPALFTPAFRGGSGSPLVCLHGFMDTWRTWELVLPALVRRHDVLAPTLPGHAGGPPITGGIDGDVMADAVERAMDAAGFGAAHLVGNSLGGYVALRLATRGRALSVVALAPAGGWARDDESYRETLAFQRTLHHQLRSAAPYVDAMVAERAGRRRATRYITEQFDHIPAELIAHITLGAAACPAADALVDSALGAGFPLEAERIACSVRVVWGTDDRLLPWPEAAARFREEWLPQADWVVLDGVGHCPQLDVPLETAQLILGFTEDGPA
jgi:pimeloyl-ACP methyl ester carboxylesterase